HRNAQVVGCDIALGAFKTWGHACSRMAVTRNLRGPCALSQGDAPGLRQAMRQPAPETLPARLYSDAAVYQTERREIFARTWQLFAHESQLPRPGDYLATHFAGYPIVAVRGDDGAVRAFHNVCRHRAGPLVEDGAGHCAGALVCR